MYKAPKWLVLRMIHGSQGFRILPKGFRIVRITKQILDKTWSHDQAIILFKHNANCEAFIREVDSALWLLGHLDLKRVEVLLAIRSVWQGLAMSLGEEEVEHVMETCWVSSVHRSAPARAMRFLTYKVFSQKTPQVNRSSNTTNFHKKNKSPLILDKKHAPKKQKTLPKPKKTTWIHEDNSEEKYGPDPSIPRSNNQAPIQKCSRSRILWK